MIPANIIERAKIQSQFNNTKTNIFQMTDSKTYVIAPDGYIKPKHATLVGYVESNGNFVNIQDNPSLQERD